MKRIALALLCLLTVVCADAAKKKTAAPVQTDREFWVQTIYKISEPVLRNMAEGKLQQNMPVEVGPTWDHRNIKVAYLETFGRLMMGIAPWLSLPDDDTAEGQMRRQLRGWALKAYAHAVDPQSPDYLLWREEGQTLVDAAFLAESFLRGWDALWIPLDAETKQRYCEEFTQLHRVDPPYSNWLLFSSTIEAFLAKAGFPYDLYRINSAIRKIDEWYVGDGWYSDGQEFAFNYYNSYVIQPMYVETLQTCLEARIPGGLDYAGYYQKAVRRMQKYGIALERFISPEGTFPVFGRSIPYRTAAMQPLAMLAWRDELPAGLSYGQVRAALTAVMHRTWDSDANFSEGGWLNIGFNGHQVEPSDSYSNNGSLYLTAAAFLPLGLPAGHPFWTAPAEPWTNVKAWGGQEFPKDQVWPDTGAREEHISRIARRVFSLAVSQFTLMDRRLGEGQCPRSLRGPEGEPVNSDIGWWCSGFFPGSLWYVYQYTKDERIKALAEKHTLRLEPLKDRRTDHDIGFQLNSSYGNAYAFTGDERYLPMIKVGADKLADRFNEAAGVTRSWNDRHFPVIIDNMMNLEILMNAWELFGDERYRQIALTHANTTIKNHFRPDYSTWHMLDYDPETGAVLARQTVQGFSDDSMWARGEAWALYGYTMMYRKTGVQAYLDQARHIADLVMSRLPEDGIPYWDFDAPDIPDAYRDASAGAIMASALVQLGQVTGESRYRKFSEKQLRTLAGPGYLATPGTNGGFLLKHSVGNLPGHSEVDVPLTYADYYFLEALYYHTCK